MMDFEPLQVTNFYQHEMMERRAGRMTTAVLEAAGWEVDGGLCRYHLADGSTVSVHSNNGRWHWSWLAADGKQARYSPAYTTERDAWRAAISYINDYPKPEGSTAALPSMIGESHE